MEWTKVIIDTTVEAVDSITWFLGEMEIYSVEIEDHLPLTEEERREMYVDLLPDEIAPNDGKAKVSFYLEDDSNLDEIVKNVERELKELSTYMNIGSGEITIDSTKEEDWVNNWKQYFKPFYVDEHIMVKPTWETVENVPEEDLIVEIDPGTAFGTGSHETTKLCMRQLKKYVKNDTVLLDVGCGSAILSILGLKLGAKYAVDTDIDPNAVRAAKENFEVNHLEKEQYEVLLGNILDDEQMRQDLGRECYDIVVANILADVIIPLSSLVPQFLKKDGVFISSGIINTKEEEVKQAILDADMKIIEISHMGDWVSITAMRK
ncbi:MAG: 50S ribosomal protein L11 methyltransferase [Lachnospiraceae bacterium]